MNFEKRLLVSLFILRVGVFIVMIMWTLDKFVNPGHTAGVFKKFYLMDGIEPRIAYGIGLLQLLLVVDFFFGIKKSLTYGALFILHFLSTLSTWQMYLDPWGPRNLLFFAAWPMLSALFALYFLRDKDTLFQIR